MHAAKKETEKDLPKRQKTCNCMNKPPHQGRQLNPEILQSDISRKETVQNTIIARLTTKIRSRLHPEKVQSQGNNFKR
jgi:hypothetical protein